VTLLLNYSEKEFQKHFYSVEHSFSEKHYSEENSDYYSVGNSEEYSFDLLDSEEHSREEGHPEEYYSWMVL
jgi:hypothetical protein